MWRPRLNESARMKYLGIVEALEADIRAGRVVSGQKLPPQRAIAEALDVDLTTVTRAFNEARRRGLIAAQVGRGTFITEGQGDRQSPSSRRSSIDLSMNIPPQPPGLDFQKIFSQGISSILDSPNGLLALHYQESNGAEIDRIAGARWLKSRIEGVTSDRIVVTGGAQCALYAISSMLFQRGDLILAGEMTYPGLKAVATQQGLIVEPIAMDEDGIIPDEIARICREKSPKALYVIPTIDNPTTASIPIQRRREIVALARKHHFTIIEDDPYSSLSERRLISFAELANDITWHIATLSKCVTAALRVAYSVAPNASMALRLATVLRATNIMAPPLMSALATHWINTGTIKEITKDIISENISRQALAATIFQGCNYAAVSEAPHLWLSLPKYWNARDFAECADRIGVSIVPSSAFATAARYIEAVRISLGVSPDRTALKDGLIQISNLMMQPSLQTRAIV
ncbi:PLP-dependent aminotransferase family protein (plasmid) [Kozakia baliensis]|uniref:aminotransferase-like domain-containing protein n=1 Tax=Kozakia baliensis TaxID=153496 RepID=UPI00345C0D7B